MFSINRAFSTPKSILSIDAKLETKQGRAAEAIFVKINHFNDGRDVTMLFDAHALRALSIACGELHATGASAFRKYTQKGGCRSTLSLGRKEAVYYINIERRCGEKSERLEHPFGTYSLQAFAQTLALMCDETEKALFAQQCREERG